ncbi:MAG: mechanosensitive ion channel protein [Flavobacteriaceae bacterium]|nr:mechanosensitive ion channel protein [Flavobacteriaceae bacterium]
MKNEVSKILQDYQKHLEFAIEYLWIILPNIFLGLLIAIVGWWVIKIINHWIAKFFNLRTYDPTLVQFVQDFINYALKVLLFVTVITQLGVKTSSLIAILGAAGLAIGLALQGSLSNFAGGILLLVFKPFKVGDWISAQGTEGSVKQITVFSTKLNTFGNQEVIIPNGSLSNGSIINYSSETNRRDNFKIGIGYTSDLKKAKELLLELCNNHELVLQEPAPVCVVDELGDFSVNLSLRYWTKRQDFWSVRFHIIEATKLTFDANGIEIPFPHQVMVSEEIKSD